MLYNVKGSFVTVKTFSFLELNVLFLPGFSAYFILDQKRHLYICRYLSGKKKLNILLIKGGLRFGFFFLIFRLKGIYSLKMEQDVITNKIFNLSRVSRYLIFLITTKNSRKGFMSSMEERNTLLQVYRLQKYKWIDTKIWP